MNAEDSTHQSTFTRSQETYFELTCMICNVFIATMAQVTQNKQVAH